MIKNYCNETKQTAQWWSEARTQVSAQSDKSLRCPHEENVSLHYENTPIQTYWKFYQQRNENFQIKNSNIFHISAQNIDCGYLLEPPRRGGSNEYP